MKPSVFKQTEAYPVAPAHLRTSPRHWNPGLLFHEGKLWLAYRFHRKEAKQRCGIAICAVGPDFQPIETSQFLRLRGPTGEEHHEDCRLFMFDGQPHISYTEMRGYRPGVNYTCVLKYARLSLDSKGRWKVEAEYHPQYGLNAGHSKEKNWTFFDSRGGLFCVYSIQPEHKVVQVRGHTVLPREHVTPGPVWHWGLVRGGTPPIWIGDCWLAVFHSSLPTEVAPHFVRYYAGAYTFEAEPPFKILEVSESPILSGSEEDGHQVDPRYVEGWKPYVVFPCGLQREENGKFLISLGVNDWQCAIARLSLDDMRLGSADGSTFKTRFFKVANGTIPIKYTDQAGRIQFMEWKVFRPGRCGMAGTGYMKAANARDAAEAADHEGAQEITENEFLQAERGLPHNPTMIVAQ